MKDYKKVVEIPVEKIKIISKDVRLLDDERMKNFQVSLQKRERIGVRIDIWTHFMRGCIIDYVH